MHAAEMLSKSNAFWNIGVILQKRAEKRENLYEEFYYTWNVFSMVTGNKLALVFHVP